MRHMSWFTVLYWLIYLGIRILRMLDLMREISRIPVVPLKRRALVLDLKADSAKRLGHSNKNYRTESQGYLWIRHPDLLLTHKQLMRVYRIGLMILIGIGMILSLEESVLLIRNLPTSNPQQLLDREGRRLGRRNRIQEAEVGLQSQWEDWWRVRILRGTGVGKRRKIPDLNPSHFLPIRPRDQDRENSRVKFPKKKQRSRVPLFKVHLNTAKHRNKSSPNIRRRENLQLRLSLNRWEWKRVWVIKKTCRRIHNPWKRNENPISDLLNWKR